MGAIWGEESADTRRGRPRRRGPRGADVGSARAGPRGAEPDIPGIDNALIPPGTDDAPTDRAAVGPAGRPPEARRRPPPPRLERPGRQAAERAPAAAGCFQPHRVERMDPVGGSGRIGSAGSMLRAPWIHPQEHRLPLKTCRIASRLGGHCGRSATRWRGTNFQAFQRQVSIAEALWHGAFATGYAAPHEARACLRAREPARVVLEARLTGPAARPAAPRRLRSVLRPRPPASPCRRSAPCAGLPCGPRAERSALRP